MSLNFDWKVYVGKNGRVTQLLHTGDGNFKFLLTEPKEFNKLMRFWGTFNLEEEDNESIEGKSEEEMFKLARYIVENCHLASMDCNMDLI